MKSNHNIAAAGLLNMIEELRNPVTNIKLCTDLLDSADDDMKEDYCAMIKANTDKIESCIRDITSLFYKEEFIINLHTTQDFAKTY